MLAVQTPVMDSQKQAAGRTPSHLHSLRRVREHHASEPSHWSAMGYRFGRRRGKSSARVPVGSLRRPGDQAILYDLGAALIGAGYARSG